jgi:putative membrane protein
MKPYLILIAKGFVVGAIDIVAGVSGGTIAIIVGIYADLLKALHRFDLTALKLFLSGKWKELLAYIPWKFLASVSLGVFFAVITMARVLDFFFAQYPLYTWAALFGLVGTSAFYVRTHIRKQTPALWAVMVLAALAAYKFVDLIPTQTPNSGWFLSLVGLIAVCAALLPGLSGSFTLILLGKYQFILEAINTRDLPVLAWFGAGAIVGLLLFVRAITWLLDHHNDLTMSILTGLMIGSMRKVWPWRDGFEGNTMIALVCMAIGVAFVIWLHRIAKKVA